MTFTDFCRANSLDIIHAKISNQWQRCGTISHPSSKNGAYIFDGERGACMNWSADLEPNIYTPTGQIKPVDREWLKTQQARQKAEKDKLNAAAAKKAAWLLSQAKAEKHAYLERKGFKGKKLHVYEEKLIIPMFVQKILIGCQSIDIEGDKRFIYGQQTSYATHTIGSGNVNFLCEGYATGLSVQAALSALNIKYKIHVTFSAGNMLKVARNTPKGFIIADNDESLTGETVAREIGWKYYLPETIGHDANDALLTMGLFKFSQQIALQLGNFKL